MTPGHGAAPWVPAGLCREVLDTGLVRGAPAQVCCRGLTHQCRIPSSTYKGLRGFHTSRVWPCCHHMEGKLRHRDGGCRRTEISNRSNRSSSRGEGAWLCRLPGSRPLCCLLPRCTSRPAQGSAARRRRPRLRCHDQGRGGCASHAGSETPGREVAAAGARSWPEPWTAVKGYKGMLFLCEKF